MDATAPLSTDLRTLSYAEHFCIWAIRTSVACSPQCRTLMREFYSGFGSKMGEAVAAYHDVMISLGKGKRKVRIGRPGHISLTADETSLLLLFAAAQHRDRDRFEAQARWIMGDDQLGALYEDIRRFTVLLAERRHVFRPADVLACGGPALFTDADDARLANHS